MNDVKIKKIDELFNEFDSAEKPGVVVGVTQNGETQYVKAFGMANLEYGLALSLDSVLQAGSVSKQFTAFAILLLSEEGKIDLDDPVKKYLDYFPEFDHEITVRHFVHHVSGLRSSVMYMMVNGVAMDDVFTNDLDITMTKKQQALNFEPDTFYTYCNLSYSLMAEIVASVTGKSFRAYVDERIFKPLGMTNSFFHDTKFELIKNKAEAYSVSPNGILNCPLVHSSYGSTNLFTTVKDMILWANELMNPTVFPKATVEKAFTPHVCKNGYKSGYGFGFTVHDYQGKLAVEHGGADAGYRAQIYMIPEEKTAVLLLSNRGDFLSMRYAKKTLDIALDLPDISSTLQKIPANIDISGTYYVEKSKTTYPFIKSDEGTFLTVAEMKIEVLKKEENRYVIPEFDVEFTLDENGKIQVYSNGNTLFGEKIHTAPITESDRKYAGKYIGIEFDSVHDVDFTEDTLRLTNNKTGEVPFKKYDNGIYIDVAIGMVSVRFDGDTMYITSNRAVNVEFRKFTLT